MKYALALLNKRMVALNNIKRYSEKHPGKEYIPLAQVNREIFELGKIVLFLKENYKP